MEVLTSSGEAEYFNPGGLRSTTGLPEELWDVAILKELKDNALDNIDRQNDKRIEIIIEDKYLALFDNGPGFDKDLLDRIHGNFNVYVSSKRLYKSCSRGAQGNALKTLQGICYIKGYKMVFQSDGKMVSYKVNPSKLKAGIVEFEKEKGKADDMRKGVVVRGINLNLQEVKDKVAAYHMCNPDVTFALNSETMEAVSDPIKRTDKTYINWYDLRAFNNLLQAVNNRDPDRTVKNFLSKFSGSRSIKLELNGKRLSEIADDEEVIRKLYWTIRLKISTPSPNILRKFVAGKEENLQKIYSHEISKYKAPLTNQYLYNEAQVPYVLEGCLLYSSNKYSSGKILTAVNNSITYEDCPFYLVAEKVKFLDMVYPLEEVPEKDTSGVRLEQENKVAQVIPLKSLLDAAGFRKARGMTLYLHLVTPHLEFSDMAKTSINATRFSKDLIKLVEHLLKGVIKEIRRKEKLMEAFDREKAKKKREGTSKVGLMRIYFIEGFEAASGGKLEGMKSKATARQVFYDVRNKVSIITKHKKELTQSDFKTFTQDVCTEMLERYSELDGRILFETRGYFLNPLTGEQLPLGTEDVMRYVNRNISHSIQSKLHFDFDIPDHLMFSHVLFIEKQGFNIILREHGVLDDLNLGLMSTAGFSTRASKILMKYFIERGITVYIMCDCDISGYLILHKIKNGSKTFPWPLPVKGIGMTVADAKEWGKESYAEEVKRDSDYKNALSALDLSVSEKNFFVIDEEQKKYRRVELNSLTVPELIKFVRTKIKPMPIKPTAEELKKCIQMDKEEIVKKALFNAYGKIHIDNVSIDMDRLVNRMLSRINGKRHWIYSLQDELMKFKDELASDLAKKMIKK